ncbi:protein serine/threonine phosphatase 2C [Irpex rosettiformis]|uniref:Protein serine/threonine phosphatase 2C n=1 Tax=Irpex rosettiformis TaxID=378272 RepID=A0ACB8U193_9APHY|nr:protein serine/threonine phosphatase 2C [Irpex rosettiformis]
MEDAHSVVVPFAGIHGQGFFAIFDGHAGKHAAEWCGQNFSIHLLDRLRKASSEHIPDILNETFHAVDHDLTKMAEQSEGKMHSGCTAVTAFLRLEDATGRQSFLPPHYDPLGSSQDLIESEDVTEGDEEESREKTTPSTADGKPTKASKLKNAIRSIGTSSHARKASQGSTSPSISPKERKSQHIFSPPPELNVRRVLYCANAGDARGVLCRAGKAVRLTYDHKGTDKQEAKRIMDAGGFVMSGRVNGVLAVTRALGDSSMKEFVVGAPYTTETDLTEEDEFIILACDGLWDVVEDQGAVDLVRAIADPKKAADELLDHAYKNYSTDNVTVIIVRFRNPVLSS